MNNLSSYCALVDAKIRASNKDLSVFQTLGYKDSSFGHNSNMYFQSYKFQFSESFSFELYVCNHFFPSVLILLALLLQKLCMSFVLYGVRTTLV